MKNALDYILFGPTLMKSRATFMKSGATFMKSGATFMKSGANLIHSKANFIVFSADFMLPMRFRSAFQADLPLPGPPGMPSGAGLLLSGTSWISGTVGSTRATAIGM